MFGSDVHLRAYADLQRFGIAGQLARIGLDKYSRDLADVKFELAAVATRGITRVSSGGIGCFSSDWLTAVSSQRCSGDSCSF